MAHANFRLVLLHSCPDTVHGITLHKTLLSTFLTARKPSINLVEKGVQLCYSGLQIQGAANSPPTRSLYIIYHFFIKSNLFYLFLKGKILSNPAEWLTKNGQRSIIIETKGERVWQKIVRTTVRVVPRTVLREKKRVC